MHDVLTRLGELRIIPVVSLESAEAAAPLAEALLAGGLPCAEVTFRTAAAEESIRRLAGLGTLLVGAGTVLTTDQAARALDAGAQFLVSPGTSEQVVRFGLERHAAVLPGVATPTEVERALSLGLEAVKFFPAEAFGGLATLQAIAAPYRAMRFVPTGGITAANVRKYLSFGPVLACGGSWMVKPELLRAGRFDEVERLTAQAVELAR